MFRHIFHDWSDQYAAKILKNLVPALKKGSKIWISELVLSDLSDRNHTKDQMQRQVNDDFLILPYHSAALLAS